MLCCWKGGFISRDAPVVMTLVKKLSIKKNGLPPSQNSTKYIQDSFDNLTNLLWISSPRDTNEMENEAYSD